MKDLALNFLTRDWLLLKEWLVAQKRTKMTELASPKCDERETALLRGELRFIDKLLAQETYAGQAKVAPFSDD